MSVSEKLHKDTEQVWNKIIEHPFVVELYQGSLAMEKFKTYILQDYSYLVDTIKNFSIIASRAQSVDVLRETVEIAHLEATGEFQGYEDFLHTLGYTLDDAMNVEPFPVNLSYRGFLLTTSSLRSSQEALVSVLPCFWTYLDIALYHQDALRGNANKIYVDWASVYLSKDYAQLVEKLRRLVDRICDDFPYERLKLVFLTASRYEYMYWDAAYNLESWPV
ncbi:MAG: thiaminase II [Desulfobacterium sp. 4572_20]|mgnify:CR=1 FL=1|nr:MAG: thiaminase II [Desulfobacterium sp. 4572_20]RLB21300.1 MAG: thiaminase II [Deltaproteobacteria bacterium]